MIDTFPLTFIAISAVNTLGRRSLFCQITNVILFYLLDNQTLIAIIKVACNQDLRFRCYGMNGIYRLTKTVCCCLTERTTVFLTPKTTGEMNHKDMKHITRNRLSTSIEDITGRSHLLYWCHANGITTDGGKRKG